MPRKIKISKHYQSKNQIHIPSRNESPLTCSGQFDSDLFSRDTQPSSKDRSTSGILLLDPVLSQAEMRKLGNGQLQ